MKDGLKRILDYVIGEKIYNGSRTLVYRGQRLNDGQPVIIKILKNSCPSTTELAQFRNQYTIAKNLNLPGIIKPYSLEPYENSYALIMEDFGGVSLKYYIHNYITIFNNALLCEFVEIAIQITDILTGLYNHRVIHKDIKPANILINPNTKQVKLIDFSIASLVPEKTSILISPDILEGTLAYISPEQTGRINGGVDYRSDYYSLGITLFELLTGRLPFECDDAMELIHCHIAKQPPQVNSLNVAIPLALSKIISNLMQKKPEHRYQTPLEIKKDLEICFQQFNSLAIIEKVRGSQENLQASYLDKSELIEAERNRIIGKHLEAMDCYDNVIAFAKQHGYVQEEALANELAGKFYLSFGKKKIAQVYITEAYNCYAYCGLKAKTDELEQEYFYLHNQEKFAASKIFSSDESTVNSNISSFLDLESILKALHTLSSEINLDQLLSTLIWVVAENAGANRGLLLLPNSVNEWIITAQYQNGFACSAATNQLQFPRIIVNHVQRTQQEIIINNSLNKSPFIDDIYFNSEQPQSLLCSPIFNQGKIVAILYLENTLTANVFTDSRMQVLNFICSQAAISLENARLFQQSQAYAQQLEKSLQDLQQVQDELLQRTEELRLSEIRFQRVADNIPGMIYQAQLIAGGSISLTYASSGCRDLFEMTPQEVAMDVLLLLTKLHPDDRQSYEDSIKISAQTIQPWMWEGRFNLPSGKEKWVQAASRPELQPDGSIIWDGIMIDISERKATEQALRQSEERLRTVTGSAPVILYAVDREGRFTFSEGQGLEALGSKSRGVVGESIYELYRDYPDLIENMNRALAGESLTYKSNIAGVFLETRYTPIYNKIGEVEGVIGVAIDISDRKFAEAALEASLSQIEYQANLLRSVIDATSNWIFIKDKNFRYILVNKGAADSIGKSFKEILGKNDLEVGFPAELVFGNPQKGICGFRSDDEAVLSGETIHNSYDVVTIADGSQRIHDTQKIPLRDYEGNIIGIINIGIDVTERRLEKIQLRESQQFLKLILDTIPQHVYWKDSNLVYLGCNCNFARIAGVGSPEDIIGKTDYDLPWNKQDNNQHRNYSTEAVTESDRTIIKSGNPVLDIIEPQLQADGKQAWIETTKVPLHDAEGNIIGILGAFHDITVRREAEMALQQVNEQLEQRVEQRTAEMREAKELADSANRAKSEFLANMSHELRTPLNGILGYTQILQRDQNLKPQYKQKIEIIHQCGSHLLTLINDILDLSKIEARKLDLAPTDFNLESFIQGIIEIFRIRAEQKGITFVYEVLDKLPPVVQADEKRLRQVLINLLGNAIKFTDSGRVTFKVELVGSRELGIESREYQKGNQFNSPLIPPLIPTPYSLFPTSNIRFQVEDTGIGIVAKELKKIFLPFEQVGNKRRMAEGTGLGLAISQRITQMMGSCIQVISTPGEGSVFWFDIELTQTANPVESINLQLMGNIIGYEGNRHKILVIDDRWDNRSVVVNLLEPLGFECFEAADGQLGIEAALLHQPDLIITDLAMPVLDGLEMTQLMRKYTEFANTVIIASSASVFESDRTSSIEAGANDFLPKPIATDELLSQIGRYLNVTWIFDTEANNPKPKTQIQTSTFTTPPHHELKSLHLAARMGDIEMIEQEANRIHQLDVIYKPFANKLLEFVQEMNEAAILKLIQQAIEKNS
jgi:PAS domain S-box-containing protein